MLLENKSAKKLTNSIMAKEKEAEAMASTCDLIMNGYFDIVKVIWYFWLAGYDSMTRYGVTLNKATLKYTKNKRNIAHFMSLIKERLIPKVMQFESKHKDVYRENMYKMCLMTKNIVYPTINRIGNAEEAWRMVTVIYMTNKFRAENGERRLCWNEGEFYHQARQRMRDTASRATATETMTKIVRIEVPETTTNNTTNSGSKRSRAHIQCWICKQYGHYQSECPKSRGNPRNKRSRYNNPKPKYQQNPNPPQHLGIQHALQQQQQMARYPQHHGYHNNFPMQYSNQLPPQQHHFQQQYQYPPPQQFHHQHQQQWLNHPQGNQIQHVPPKGDSNKQNRGPNRRQNDGAQFYEIRNGKKRLRDEYKNYQPCVFFDHEKGNECKFIPERCNSPHFCSGCGSLDHGRRRCNRSSASLFATPR